ncbi:MAG: hypothetical protein K9L78_05225 [Victivallales bacterium]|nr:hypothetical protein [Victivallales bacterium]MCF7889503.1 hypothetical protein [Victivallales bacterium]
MQVNSKLKKILITFIGIASLAFSATAAENVIFKNYDYSNGYKSVYTSSPLGCSYESDIEQKINNYGRDWKMKSAVTSHGLNYKEEYVLNGYSKLISNSWITGFTGATFVIVKDNNGQEMYLASVKTRNPIATVNVSSSQAEEVSWGINPGRLDFYVAGYKYKKVLWWKVKLPIIKSRVIPNKRTVNWTLNLPTYIVDRDITVELVNVHTPTHRVLAALKDTGKKTASFLLANGIQTKALYEKAQNGELTYTDVENYINGVLAWAETQELIDSAKSQNVTNIMAAIHQMINNSPEGLQPENHDALVAIAFNITSIISDQQANPQTLRSLINQIEEICQDKSGFVPENLQSVEIILVNLKGLIGEHLSDKQEGIYDNITETIATVNDWNEAALSEHQEIIFNGMRLIIDLYEKIHNRTITVEEAEILINNWLDEVETLVYTEMPQHSSQFNYFREVILNNIFNLLVSLESSSWL